MGNQSTLTQQYDVFNRLINQTTTHPTQAFYDNCDYQYDSENQLVKQTVKQGIESQSTKSLGTEQHTEQTDNIKQFAYNSLGQLIRETVQSDNHINTKTYQWDSFGNPLSQHTSSSNNQAEHKKINEQLMDNDTEQLAKQIAEQTTEQTTEQNKRIEATTDGDRLTQFADSDYRYDELGNQTAETGNGIKNSRVFNAFNQLTRYSNNGHVTEYDYDAFGRRIAKHTQRCSIDYIWDGDQLLGEYQQGQYTWYINIPNQFYPIALIKRSNIKNSNVKNNNVKNNHIKNNDRIFYYHVDQLNTPRFVTNAKAEVVWENQTDAYGYVSVDAVNSDTNNRNSDVNRSVRDDKNAQSKPSKQAEFTQPLRFQGQYFDDESGLHYNRYRYYSPKQQRFIHQDPIGLVGGLNHYQYAPNPVNWVDPMGLMCKEGEESLKEALNTNVASGCISSKLSDKLLKAAQDGNLAPKEIKQGLAALALAKVAPAQSIVNLTTTNITKIAVQTAANDALFIAEESLLARVAPWLGRALGTASLLAYSPSTGGALDELKAPDGTTYSKHSDEVYYKAVGIDGNEWSTDDPQQDIQFRMWKANGGEGSLEDWLAQGMPDNLGNHINAGTADKLTTSTIETESTSKESTPKKEKLSPFKKNKTATPKSTVKEVVKVTAGSASDTPRARGSWAKELENPQPNTIYEATSIHDGQPAVYTYETDEQGRTIKVTGKLKKSAIKDQTERDKKHRSSKQSSYGGDDPNYDGGHLVGTLFQGPAEKLNLVPQLKDQNRYGEWRQMEKDWAKELDKGNAVEVEILVEYDGDNKTPSTMRATSVVNGVKQKPQDFDN